VLTALVPTASRVAVLMNPANTGNVLQVHAVQRAAKRRACSLLVLEARRPETCSTSLPPCPARGCTPCSSSQTRCCSIRLVRIPRRLSAAKPDTRDVRLAQVCGGGGLMSYGQAHPVSITCRRLCG